MKIQPRSATLPLLALLASGSMIAAPVRASGSSCDVVYDVGIKQVQTPHHTHTTMKSASTGKTTTSEGVFAAGGEYSRLGDGAWKRSNMSQQDSLEMAQRKRSHSSTDTCKNLGNDAGAGTAATLYSVHRPRPVRIRRSG